jgi:hypothetical protein
MVKEVLWDGMNKASYWLEGGEGNASERKGGKGIQGG